MPYIGQSLTEGTRREYSYVATAGQTVFPAIYTVGAVDVHQNGILLPPSDYTATDGTTVVFATGCAVDDEVVIHCHNTFSVADTYRKADTYTKTEADAKFVDASGDTMTGALNGRSFITADDTNNYALMAGRYSAGYGGAVINTTSNASFLELQVNGFGGLRADSAGRVTMPYQPAFSAYGTGILSWASGSYALKIVPLIYAQNNIGGHFSTSTYRFTAPVTGSYYFSAKATQTNSATGPSLFFTKNGAVFGHEASIGYYTAYHSFTGSTVMHLNANDYVSIYIGNNNSVAMDIELSRSSFSGYLIG